MRKLILLALLFISAESFGQLPWTVINGKQRFTKGLGIPTIDTAMALYINDSSQIVLNPSDSVMYYRYKGYWKPIGGGGSITIPTLQQVLDFDHSLTSNNNYQGNNGTPSFGGSNNNLFGGQTTASLFLGSNNNFIGSDLANNSIVFGSNINAFGYNINTNGNSDINLFGKNATATDVNQIVFTKDDGALQTRINQLNTTDIDLNLPATSGTIALVSDIPTITTPTLQQVLTSGDTAIQKEIYLIRDVGDAIYIDGDYSSLRLGTGQIYGRGLYDYFFVNPEQLGFRSLDFTKDYSLIPPITKKVGNHRLILPHSDSLYAVTKVNGNIADSSGNITISTGSGTVTSISQGYGITNSTNPITTTGTIKVDTTISGLSGKYLRIIDTSTLSTRIDLRVKYSDTSSMLSPYLRKVDTTNKWVNNITRTVGKDSIIFLIDGNRYAIKDSVGTNPAPVGYYGAFSDTINQPAAVINTGYPMKFRVNDITPNGVTIVSNSRITFANSGIYNLQWSAQFVSSDNAENDVGVWLRKDGVDVAGSRGLVSVPKKIGLIYGHSLPSWNFVVDVAAGSYYEFVWSTSNTNVQIEYIAGNSFAPTTAATVLTVTQQSGIMAGTGITAINGLTGAAQTLAVGTDSTDFKIASTGTTHKFNLPTASATKRGALSSTDWSTFNSKIGAADTSVFLRKTDSVTYYTKYRSDTSRTNIYNAITPKFTTPTGWTDYFASSTIVGGTGAAGVINYIVMGKILFVQFNIDITSTATNFSFTLPYTNGTTPQFGLGRGKNNGTSQASVGMYMAASTNVVTLLWATTNITTPNVWTAANGKSAQGFLILNIP